MSEWADKYRKLSRQESVEPGDWNTDRTPYLRGIQDAFSDPEIREIVVKKASQLGLTEAEMNMIGWAVDQDPGPIMHVMPTQDMAEKFSEIRLQSMLKNSPALAEKYDAYNSRDLMLQFGDAFMLLVGANSPTDLSSWSIRYLFFDEINKFPARAGREASPMKLAEERTKNWFNHKIMKASTPTTKDGHISISYEMADEQRAFFVPCPHCGAEQVLTFKSIKWPEGMSDPSLVVDRAWYECEKCRDKIFDYHKPAMMRAGNWKAIKKRAGRSRSVAFHLSSIYSSWITFGKMAAEFLKSKDDPDLLMNFINSWLGEDWEDTAATMDRDLVLDRQAEHEDCEVPEAAMVITGGVDVQEVGYYYTIRAWAPRMTSWNVTHGYVEDWTEVERVMNRRFVDKNGEIYQVNLCCVDSGHKTEDVYDFCLMNGDWAVPIKGASTPMLTRFKMSLIDRPGARSHGQKLYIVDTDQYKNMIAARMARPNGDGAWMVHKDCDLEYAEQITSEHKIRAKKGNRVVETWQPKSSASRNHFLDCEVYAACAADILGVRYLEEVPDASPVEPVKEEKHEQQWIEEREDWLE